MIQTSPPSRNTITLSQMRMAAVRIYHLYPKEIADVLYLDIHSWWEFGYLFDNKATMVKLISFINNSPIPEVKDAA